MRMLNVWLRECWGKGAACAERTRFWLLLEEERSVEHGIPYRIGYPETDDDLPGWVGQVTRRSLCKRTGVGKRRLNSTMQNNSQPAFVPVTKLWQNPYQSEQSSSLCLQNGLFSRATQLCFGQLPNRSCIRNRSCLMNLMRM